MSNKECIAVILAGGQGSRLSSLIKTVAKPAVPFGGKYRIIDFTLSNCYNSHIDTVGIITQYQPFTLHSYLGGGKAPALYGSDGGLFILPPHRNEAGGEWYTGTANAIFQNIDFVDRYNPRNIIVLSGDHIYKMDYRAILRYHQEKQADVTISVVRVPWEEAGRFGIMNTDDSERIRQFEEKPEHPGNNLASMGIYVFNRQLLKRYLAEDDQDNASRHDFGRNIIPNMLRDDVKLFAYEFGGYWMDVGTVESLWRANMDLLGDHAPFDLYDADWPIYSASPLQPPHFIAGAAIARRSLVSLGCVIGGDVEGSVLCPGVSVAPGAIVKNSVIMSNVVIGENTRIFDAIIGSDAAIGDNCEIGVNQSDKIAVVGEGMLIPPGTRLDTDELAAVLGGNQ